MQASPCGRKQHKKRDSSPDLCSAARMLEEIPLVHAQEREQERDHQWPLRGGGVAAPRRVLVAEDGMREENGGDGTALIRPSVKRLSTSSPV